MDVLRARTISTQVKAQWTQNYGLITLTDFQIVFLNSPSVGSQATGHNTHTHTQARPKLLEVPLQRDGSQDNTWPQQVSQATIDSCY